MSVLRLISGIYQTLTTPTAASTALLRVVDLPPPKDILWNGTETCCDMEQRHGLVRNRGMPWYGTETHCDMEQSTIVFWNVDYLATDFFPGEC